MNCVGIFVTPDSCVLRIYITGCVKVCFVVYERQLNIYESIVSIFHHPITKPNPFWNISTFKLIFTVKICYVNKKQAVNRSSLPHHLTLPCYELHLLFDLDDGGSIFLRNVDIFLYEYTALMAENIILHSHLCEKIGSNIRTSYNQL